MAARLRKAQRLREIDKLIAVGLRPKEIQNQLGISEVTYYRDVKELYQKMHTDEALAQHDKDINARWDRLDRIVAIDLERTKDDPIGRAKVLTNALKLNKERLDYYLKTGKIRDKPTEINLNHSGNVMNELSYISKYLKDSNEDSDEDKEPDS